MLVQVFKLGSLHGFLHHDLLILHFFLEVLVERGAVWGLHPLLAIRAVEVVEYDTGSVPLLLNLALAASQVEEMATLELDTWLLRYRGTVANRAIVIFIFAGTFIFWHLVNALWFETRKTFLLTNTSIAWMTTWMDFVA